MPDSLVDLLDRLKNERALFLSGEEATKQGAVLPILARLGWNRDNIREVVPEYSAGQGRVDYCLKINDKVSVFLEVKRTNEELERHQKQLLEYAFETGVKIAVLTNGLLWWFYLPLFEGSWDQRRFYTIDIQQQNITTANDHFKQLLSRQAIADGSALQKAHEIHSSREKERIINQTIPKAWKELCEEPDELLIELLADKVEGICGHRPEDELLGKFLSKILPPRERLEVVTPRVQPARQQQQTRISTHSAISLEGNWTNCKPVAFTFNNQKHSVRSLKEILIGLCQKIFYLHPNDINSVLSLEGRKRKYFSKDQKEMHTPMPIIGSDIFVETNLSGNSIRDRCCEVLTLFGYSNDALEVELKQRTSNME